MKRWSLLLALLMTIVAASAEEIIDQIVAVVDDEIILESEVYQYLQFSIGSQVSLDSIPPAKLDSLHAMVLDDLIAQKLLLTRARTDSIAVSTKEVDKELDARVSSLMEQVGGQDKLESYYDMPLSRIKKNFRPLVEETLLIERIRRQKLQSVKVSRSEVVAFWEQIKDSLPPLQDGIRLAHILLQDKVSETSTQAAIAKADSARKILESGEITFEEFASRNSDDPGSASRGGKLGTTSRGDLVPEYEAAAYAMEPGDISQPVISQFGVHLIRLEDRTGEKITTSHILFAIVPADDDQNKTKSLADSLVTVLRAGGNFVELTREFSIDTKTAAAGGDLGWFSPQELPDDFRAPVEGLEKGDYSEPFRTRFGVHIIKIADRIYSREITLDEDFGRVEQMALAKKQDDEFRKWVDELRAETYVEKK